MELVALAKNPAPSGATTGVFKSSGGAQLRYARWEPTRPPKRGTVCVFQGRGEFIENISRSLPICGGAASPWPPWTGAGRADRAARCSIPARATCARSPSTIRPNPFHEGDRTARLPAAVHRPCPPMGGHILLRNATLSGSWFSRMVLSAPMIAIAESRLGFRWRYRASTRKSWAGSASAPCTCAAATTCHRAWALRGQSAYLRSRALSAQPHGDRVGAAPRTGVAHDSLAARGAALDFAAHRPGLPAPRAGASAAVRRRHGTRSFRHRRSRSSRCGSRSAPTC